MHAIAGMQQANQEKAQDGRDGEVCAVVCIHLSMYTCVQVNANQCIHAYMRTCVRVSVHTCVRLSMHTGVCLAMHTCVHLSMHTNVCTHAHAAVQSSGLYAHNTGRRTAKLGQHSAVENNAAIAPCHTTACVAECKRSNSNAALNPAMQTPRRVS